MKNVEAEVKNKNSFDVQGNAKVPVFTEPLLGCYNSSAHINLQIDLRKD